MKRDVMLFVDDIIENIELIENSVRNLSKKGFESDRLIIDATTRRLEIIDEAVKNILSEFVKFYNEGIDSIVNLSSYNVIRLPSKSTGFISSRSFKNEPNNFSGLSCGILNQTTENIFSFEKCSELAKSSSFVINTLFSDFENEANLPLVSPFGFEIISNPYFLRNFSNLNFTFSSLRNLTDRDAELDIVSPSHKVSSILKSCLYMLFSQRRIIFNNLFVCHSAFQHFQNLPNHDSCSFESWLSMTYFAVGDNIFIYFNSHNINHRKGVFKFFEKNKKGS